MRASDFWSALGAIDLGDDLLAAFREADAFGVQPDMHALELDDVLDRGRHVLVLVVDEPRRHLDDRHLAAEAAVHLPEFEADIAPADNDEMVRQKIDVHHRRIRQVWRFLDAGHRRRRRPAADVDKNPGSAEPLAGDFHGLRRHEASVAAIERDVRGVFEGRGQPVSRRRHDRVRARFDPPHIDADIALDRHAILGGAPCGPAA